MPDVNTSGKSARSSSLNDTLVGRNSIFIELAGDAPLYSLNYDRLLFKNNKFPVNVSISIGIGSIASSSVYSIPMELNFLIRKLKNRLEAGLGYTPSYGTRTYTMNGIVYTKKDFDYGLFWRVGYRHQVGVILFRADITPVLYHDYYNGGKLKVAPWGGISMGFCF